MHIFRVQRSAILSFFFLWNYINTHFFSSRGRRHRYFFSEFSISFTLQFSPFWKIYDILSTRLRNSLSLKSLTDSVPNSHVFLLLAEILGQVFFYSKTWMRWKNWVVLNFQKKLKSSFFSAISHCKLKSQ